MLAPFPGQDANFFTERNRDSMAYYQHPNQLQFSQNTVFNSAYEPGQQAPYGGVYRCTGCGLEIGTAKYHALPPQNHHQHSNWNYPIRWQPVAIHG